MNYDGFKISCGCHCSRCGNSTDLEGYSDAWGSHYCPTCDDYVKVPEANCKHRTPAKVQRREKRIIKAGALED